MNNRDSSTKEHVIGLLLEGCHWFINRKDQNWAIGFGMGALLTHGNTPLFIGWWAKKYLKPENQQTLIINTQEGTWSVEKYAWGCFGLFLINLSQGIYLVNSFSFMQRVESQHMFNIN